MRKREKERDSNKSRGIDEASRFIWLERNVFMTVITFIEPRMPPYSYSALSLLSNRDFSPPSSFSSRFSHSSCPDNFVVYSRLSLRPSQMREKERAAWRECWPWQANAVEKMAQWKRFIWPNDPLMIDWAGDVSDPLHRWTGQRECLQRENDRTREDTNRQTECLPASTAYQWVCGHEEREKWSPLNAPPPWDTGERNNCNWLL